MAESKEDRLETIMSGLQKKIETFDVVVLLVEEIRELRGTVAVLQKEVEALKVEEAPGYREIVDQDLTPS